MTINDICRWYKVPRRYRMNDEVHGRYGSLSLVDGRVMLSFTDSMPPPLTSTKRKFAIKSLRPKAHRNGLISCHLEGEYGFVAEIHKDVLRIGLDIIGALPVGKNARRNRTPKSKAEVAYSVAA